MFENLDTRARIFLTRVRRVFDIIYVNKFSLLPLLAVFLIAWCFLFFFKFLVVMGVGRLDNYVDSVVGGSIITALSLMLMVLIGGIVLTAPLYFAAQINFYWKKRRHTPPITSLVLNLFHRGQLSLFFKSLMFALVVFLIVALFFLLVFIFSFFSQVLLGTLIPGSGPTTFVLVFLPLVFLFCSSIGALLWLLFAFVDVMGTVMLFLGIAGILTREWSVGQALYRSIWLFKHTFLSLIVFFALACILSVPLILFTLMLLIPFFIVVVFVVGFFSLLGPVGLGISHIIRQLASSVIFIVVFSVVSTFISSAMFCYVMRYVDPLIRRGSDEYSSSKN